MGNIIAPNGAVNSYLQDKEKRCTEKIKAILDEEGCTLIPIIDLMVTPYEVIPKQSGYSIMANERAKKKNESK